MARLATLLRQTVVITLAALVAASLPTVDADAVEPATPAVVFYTPVAGDTQARTFDVVLGAASNVTSIVLQYTSAAGTTSQTIERTDGSDQFVTTSPPLSGSVDLQATGLDANDDAVGDAVTESITVSRVATTYDFVRPRTEGTRIRPLGVFRRADGRSFARASGTTTSAVEPTADAPTYAAIAPRTSTLPAPKGTFDASAKIFREPVDLTGHPGVASRRALIRVDDRTSSAVIEAPLYYQAVTAVRSKTARYATPVGSLSASVSDQYGQAVVGVPVRLTGHVSGSRSAVTRPTTVTDGGGAATFTGSFPAGFYVAYADLNLDGRRGPREPSFEWVVGTVAYVAPGKALYHNNARTRGAGGTMGDSLRGTRAAAARRYQWIDQNGQLAYSSRAGLRAGPRQVSQPAHLTWVNAHGAPFNPRWMKKGRFETRSWSNIRRRRGLRNADTTFKQNAAYHLSVEWEVKDIKPFTSAAALNSAFANLAAAAQRSYGPGWRSRVHVKMLSNLSGGQAFALRVLSYAHAHGFTTIYLARGNATRIQIPASAHGYIDYVRGAAGGLYASPASRPGLPMPVEPPFPTSR